MTERKNKTVTTPSGASVELKEYISAGEFLDLNEAKTGEELSKSELAKRLVTAAIVSIDGAAENVEAIIRSLPLGDYLFLSKEVTKIVNGDFTEAKTQAQS
jgi:hypothetical protein